MNQLGISYPLGLDGMCLRLTYLLSGLAAHHVRSRVSLSARALSRTALTSASIAFIAASPALADLQKQNECLISITSSRRPTTIWKRLSETSGSKKTGSAGPLALNVNISRQEHIASTPVLEPEPATLVPTLDDMSCWGYCGCPPGYPQGNARWENEKEFLDAELKTESGASYKCTDWIKMTNNPNSLDSKITCGPLTLFRDRTGYRLRDKSGSDFRLYRSSLPDVKKACSSKMKFSVESVTYSVHGSNIKVYLKTTFL